MNPQVPNMNSGLFKKMVTIMSNAHNVKKSGYNKHHQYQYATEADIIEVVREELKKAGIFIFSSVEGFEKDGDITTVKILHTFVDSEDGGYFTVYSVGQGADKQDKGVYKAITGAFKYMLQKNFLIASEDDPESDGANKSYVRGAGAPAAKPQTTTTATPAKSFSSTTPKVAETPKQTTAAAPKKVTAPKPVNGAGSSKPSFSAMVSNSAPAAEEEVPEYLK